MSTTSGGRGVGGAFTPVEVEASLGVTGQSASGYDGFTALLIIVLLISTPLLGTMYVAARYGVGKVPLWFKLHLSHSNPNFVWFYLSVEDRGAIREKLSCGSKGGSLAPTKAVADVEYGQRRRPGPLLPSPVGSGPPEAIISAQKWLEKAENEFVEGVSNSA